MKKYIVLIMLCFTMVFISSCASSKKSHDGMTKEQREKEKSEKKQAKEKERNAPPKQEGKKTPVENNNNKTLPIPLENK